MDSNLAFVGLSFVYHSKELILNSGCTYHLCPNRDLFFNSEQLNFDTVFRGSGHAYKTLNR